MNPEDQKRDDNPKSFYSPLDYVLAVEARDEQNKIITYQIAPGRIHTYPTWEADLLIRNLIDAVVNDRNVNTITEPKKLEEIRKEVTVDS